MLYPCWKALGKPGSYVRHLVRAVVPLTISCCILSIPMVVAGMMADGKIGEWCSVSVSQISANEWSELLSATVITLVLYGIFRLIMRRTAQSIFTAKSRWQTWGYMGLLYIALTGVIALCAR